jgi:hypothetical protein
LRWFCFVWRFIGILSFNSRWRAQVARRDYKGLVARQLSPWYL